MKGNVLLGKYHEKRDDWTINYRVPKKNTRKLKTVWWEKAHDAGTHGTELLKRLLGGQGCSRFPSRYTPSGIASLSLSGVVSQIGERIDRCPAIVHLFRQSFRRRCRIYVQ
jgi:hypothetical protein